MYFSKTTLKKLMQITLFLLAAIAAFSASADGYADIGYRDGLLIESSIHIDSIFYLNASKGQSIESVGVGLGFTKKNYSVVFSSNYFDADKDFNIDVSISYFDVGKISYFASVNRSGLGFLNYKVGAGYSISESVSLVVNYSKRGAFFGVRRWF